jgi:hypothetical protein
MTNAGYKVSFIYQIYDSLGQAFITLDIEYIYIYHSFVAMRESPITSRNEFRTSEIHRTVSPTFTFI